MAAGAALVAGSQASAEGIHITREQAGGMAGSAALGAVGGPVGGFIGGWLGKKIGRALEPKPPQLGHVETPAGESVHWMAAERPLRIRTVSTATDDLPVDPGSGADTAAIPVQTPLDGLRPGTLDYQWAAQRSAPAPVTRAPATPVAAPRSGEAPERGTLDYQLAALHHGTSPAD